MDKEKKYLRITFKPEAKHKLIDFQVKYPHIDHLIEMLIDGKRELEGRLPKNWVKIN